MGFTPLEGLMMGTRSGSIDPGILIYLMREYEWDAQQFEEALNRHAGLLGVSGISSDFREIEKVAQAGNRRAQLALAMFADRIRSTIGSLAVTLGGVDGLIFTAGIGENSASLRRDVCHGLECLGLRLDEAVNKNCQADCRIDAPDSAGQVLILTTREEQMVASETKRLFAAI
jgi:acetate kinase